MGHTNWCGKYECSKCPHVEDCFADLYSYCSPSCENLHGDEIDVMKCLRNCDQENIEVMFYGHLHGIGGNIGGNYSLKELKDMLKRDYINPNTGMATYLYEPGDNWFVETKKRTGLAVEEDDSELREMVVGIIDLFEDYLENNSVWIENDERCGDDGEAIIYGSHYGFLQENILEILKG